MIANEVPLGPGSRPESYQVPKRVSHFYNPARLRRNSGIPRISPPLDSSND
jgi:hypothetical protein